MTDDYTPDAPVNQLNEGYRAVLCSIWAGGGQPVRSPELADGCARVAWSVSDAGAEKMARRMKTFGYAAGNARDGFTLTPLGYKLLGELWSVGRSSRGTRPSSRSRRTCPAATGRTTRTASP